MVCVPAPTGIAEARVVAMLATPAITVPVHVSDGVVWMPAGRELSISAHYPAQQRQACDILYGVPAGATVAAAGVAMLFL